MIEELTLEKNKVMTTKQIKTQDIANCIENCAIENDYWIDKKQIAPLGSRMVRTYTHTRIHTTTTLNARARLAEGRRQTPPKRNLYQKNAS